MTATADRIPSHAVLSRFARSQRYAICIPVLNEGARIRRQLAKMAPYAAQADLIIADGGSTDGALDDTILADHGVRTLLTIKGSAGLSAQMRMAMGYALAEGYEGMIFIDGNDKDDPAAIPQFTAALDAGFDHVQGSRFIPGGKAVHTPWLRYWGIRLLHAPLLARAAGFPYTDTTNGFRAYSSRFLDDPRVQPLRDVFVRYELHYYLAIRAARLGFRVCEVPVTRSYPAGEKPPSKITPWRGNFRVLRTLLQACSHAFDPQEASPS